MIIPTFLACVIHDSSIHIRHVGPIAINVTGHPIGYAPNTLCGISSLRDIPDRPDTATKCGACLTKLTELRTFGGVLHAAVDAIPTIPAGAARMVNAIEQLHRHALTWARADQACEDCAAELADINRAIMKARSLPENALATPQGLLADRDTAVERLRAACEAEAKATDALKAAASSYRQETQSREAR